MFTYKNLLDLQWLKEYGLRCTEIVREYLGKDRVLPEIHKELFENDFCVQSSFDFAFWVRFEVH